MSERASRLFLLPRSVGLAVLVLLPLSSQPASTPSRSFYFLFSAFSLSLPLSFLAPGVCTCASSPPCSRERCTARRARRGWSGSGATVRGAARAPSAATSSSSTSQTAAVLAASLPAPQRCHHHQPPVPGEREGWQRQSRCRRPPRRGCLYTAPCRRAAGAGSVAVVVAARSVGLMVGLTRRQRRRRRDPRRPRRGNTAVVVRTALKTMTTTRWPRRRRRPPETEAERRHRRQARPS